eukprot:6833956-Prymnesium_polylepis.1
MILEIERSARSPSVDFLSESLTVTNAEARAQVRSGLKYEAAPCIGARHLEMLLWGAHKVALP